ncbi:MAG: [FeFe] hydrogenase, group A [Candidatus Kapabacteria bacterium]|nr:[FeFe] hydrogenase, group A [Ignavibacteriota bacterium]MCW5884188.1 [FeFe] hydrogenase, group A [Candidatus Kapabacteria bacterium]
MINLAINGLEVQVPEGTTLLQAAVKVGVNIPTLCHIPNCEPKGACRVCLVEVKNARSLVASCAMPAQEGMRVFTATRKVRDARKMVVELLLSEHDGDCKTCDRNDDCELQEIAKNLGIDNVRFAGQKAKYQYDDSTPALIRDNGKCIKCRRCVTVCNEMQNVGALYPQGRGFDSVIGPAFELNLDTVACVQCGQCAAVCPVGAITENSHIEKVWKAIDDPTKVVLVQTAPAIRAALGECFDYAPGTLVTGKMVSALKQIGFDKVFDTNFAADLTIMEEGTELLMRLKDKLVDNGDSALPQFTSCSPGWINYMEYFFPEMMANVSTCKSPQQMFGAVAKSYYAKKNNINPADIVVVSVMPCTAKKFEAARPEMNSSGYRDVDYVLTTRELGRMILQAGIEFRNLPESEMDNPLGRSSGAADLFANTGGVMEAAVRTVYELVTGRELPTEQLHLKPLMGLEGIKTASLKIEGTVPAWSFLEGVELKVAVSHGLGNTAILLKRIKEGEEFHFVEVMTCAGGCIGGGGQPRFTTNDVREKRMAAIYREDEGKTLRKSHENPDIIEIYAEYFEKPLSHISHKLLHTHYTEKSRV